MRIVFLNSKSIVNGALIFKVDPVLQEKRKETKKKFLTPSNIYLNLNQLKIFLSGGKTNYSNENS